MIYWNNTLVKLKKLYEKIYKNWGYNNHVSSYHLMQ
jgi:hypothetical protein